MTDKKTPAGGNRRGGAEKGLGGAISASYDSRSPTQKQTGIAGLAAAGVEFTLPQRGHKQPYTKGWPSYRPDLATVAKHLSMGGNLGVHVKGYTHGPILAYFDCDDGAGMDALLRIAPALADSLRSWRGSGSGKAFFWVDDPEGRLHQQSTPDLDGEHSKREFKTSGQAAISGLHPSGQRYETNWAAPITLTVDQVITIWEQLSGQPWAEAKPARVKAEPGQGYTRNDGGDVERVKAAWTPSGVFAHHWPGCQIVQERNGELRILGNGGLLCNDGDGLWNSFKDNIGGDVFDAWAYADERDVVKDFPSILREMAAAKGIALTTRRTRRDGGPDTDGGGDAGSDDTGVGLTARQIDRLRLHLRSLDFADVVPLELQSAKGYRTGDVDRVIADTALGILWERVTLTGRISNLELSERTGFSAPTCGAAMRRLVRIFEPVERPGEGSKAAACYSVERNCVDLHTGSTVLFVCKSTQLPLATHRGHDVFVRSLSSLTPDQLAAIDAKRLVNAKAYQAEMDAATTPGERDDIHDDYKKRGIPISPIQRNRQLAARLAALADAVGPGVLRLVDALTMYGPMNRAGLGAVLHKSPSGVSRLVVQALGAGLVEDGEDDRVFLADDWRATVDELDQIVPTAGTVARRKLAAADSRLSYCEAVLSTAAADFAQAEGLRRRQQRAALQKWALIQEDVSAYNERMTAAGHAALTMDAALKTRRGETFADWQRRRAMDGQSDDLALRIFAKTLAGMDKQTAEQTAYYAGWSAYDFGQAWALRGVV